MHVIGKHFRQ